MQYVLSLIFIGQMYLSMLVLAVAYLPFVLVDLLRLALLILLPGLVLFLPNSM